MNISFREKDTPLFLQFSGLSAAGNPVAIFDAASEEEKQEVERLFRRIGENIITRKAKNVFDLEKIIVNTLRVENPITGEGYFYAQFFEKGGACIQAHREFNEKERQEIRKFVLSLAQRVAKELETEAPLEKIEIREK